MSQHASFQIAYDGEAVRDHSLDVRELAPALLSLADLVDQASRKVLGPDSKATLNVKATAAGSFVVELNVMVSLAEVLKDFFTSDGYQAADVILQILFGAPAAELARRGLLGLLRAARGGITKIERAAEPSSGPTALEVVRITLADGTQFESYRASAELARDPKARESIAGLLRPLEKPGIDTFYAGENVSTPSKRESAIVIKDEDVPYMVGSSDPDYKETISENTIERALTIVAPSFKEDLKWRVSDGALTYWVKMEDRGFAEGVLSGRISLNAKDILRVDLRTHQYRTVDGHLKTEYEVTRVKEHIPPRHDTQMRLDFE